MPTMSRPTAAWSDCPSAEIILCGGGRGCPRRRKPKPKAGDPLVCGSPAAYFIPSEHRQATGPELPHVQDSAELPRLGNTGNLDNRMQDDSVTMETRNRVRDSRPVPTPSTPTTGSSGYRTEFEHRAGPPETASPCARSGRIREMNGSHLNNQTRVLPQGRHTPAACGYQSSTWPKRKLRQPVSTSITRTPLSIDVRIVASYTRLRLQLRTIGLL